MKETIIAFDIDGTLLNNEGILPETPSHLRPRCGVNLEIVMLLQILSGFKNTKIVVWSGGGKDYAEQICREYGFDKYVWRCFGKAEYDETLYGKVDIAIDDVHVCELGDKNLIVKCK